MQPPVSVAQPAVTLFHAVDLNKRFFDADQEVSFGYRTYDIAHPIVKAVIANEIVDLNLGLIRMRLFDV